MEGRAARFGVVVVSRLFFLDIELECDASNVVKAIRDKNMGKAPIDLTSEDRYVIALVLILFMLSCS